MLEQIRRFEENREKIRASVIDNETRLKQARAIAGITESDVLAILDNLANDLASLDAPQLREFVRAIVARVVMDARDLTCRIHYEIPAISGDKLASPRRYEPPACTVERLPSAAANHIRPQDRGRRNGATRSTPRS